MVDLTDDELLAIGSGTGMSPPRPRKKPAAGLGLPLAQPVRIPANIQLPPVGVRGQDPATVASIDGLLGEQVQPVVTGVGNSGAKLSAVTPPSVLRDISDDELRAIGKPKPPRAIPARPATSPLPFRNPDTHAAFEGLRADARAQGLEVRIISGDRDNDQQQRLWDAAKPTANPNVRMQRNGLPVARPGTSKHEHGDAGDIGVYRGGKRVGYQEIIPLAQARDLHQLPGDPPHFTFKPSAGPKIRSAAELAAAARTPTPAATPKPRQLVDISDDELLAIGKATPAPPNPMAEYVSGARLQGGKSGNQPATAAMLRGETYGPTPPNTPTLQDPASESSYNPALRQRTRPRQGLEHMGRALQQIASPITTGRSDERLVGWRADVDAGKAAGFTRLDPKDEVAARQVRELSQLQDTLAKQVIRPRVANSGKLIETSTGETRHQPDFKAAFQGMNVAAVRKELGKRGVKLTPFQQQNLAAALEFEARRPFAEQDRAGNIALDVGVNVGSAMAGAGAGKFLAPIIGKAPAAAQGLLRAMTEGGAGMAVQKPVTRKILDPNATPLETLGDVGTGFAEGAFGGAVFHGLGLGLRNSIQTRKAASTAAAEAAANSARAQVRGNIAAQRATRRAPPRPDAIRTQAPTRPASRLSVDRAPATGRFTKAGDGMPAHRTPTLDTPEGPVPIRKGLAVEVPELSKGTRFTVDRVEGVGEGATIHLKAPDGVTARVLPRVLKPAAPVTQAEAVGTMRLAPEPPATSTPRLEGRAIPVVAGKEKAYAIPPRDPHRVTVNVEGVTKEATLTPEQLPRWETMAAAEKGAARRVARAREKWATLPQDSPERFVARAELEQAGKDARQLAMQNAAERREMTGLLTSREQAAVERKAAALGPGKRVQSPQGKGEALGAPVYGKVKVRLDNGREVSVPASETKVIQEGAPTTRERMQTLRDQAEARGRLKPVVKAETAEAAAPLPQTKPAVAEVHKTTVEVPKNAPVKVEPPVAPTHPLLTSDGYIKLPGETKAPVRKILTERTEDLIQAKRILDGVDDVDTASWSETVALSRQEDAFRHIAQPEIREAVEEVLARRQAHLDEGLRGVTREMERNGDTGRVLVHRAAAGERVWTAPDGKRHAYHHIADAGDEFTTPENLERIYNELATPGRLRRTYTTSAGPMSLRDLVMDMKMMPADAVGRRQGFVGKLGQKTEPSPRVKLKAEQVAAAQAEAQAAETAFLKKHGGKLTAGIDPEMVKDFIPVARAYVKLGYATAAELEAIIRDKVKNSSVEFARAVREALEKEDGRLSVEAPTASKTQTAASTAQVSANTAQAKPSPIVPRRPTPPTAATTSTAPVPPRERVGAMNLSRFTNDEARAEIWRAVRTNEQEIATQRRGVRSHAETDKAAEAVGITLETLKGLPPGTAANAETLRAVGGYVQHLSDAVVAARRVWEATPTDENLIKLEAAKAEQLIATVTFKGLEAEAGRALGQLGQMRRALKPKITVESVRSPELAPVDPAPWTPPRRQQIARPVAEPARKLQPAPAQTVPARSTKPAPKPDTTPAPKPIYGSENRVFTLDRAAAARERLRQKMGRSLSGVPVDLLPDALELGGFYIEAGARTFVKWAGQMRADLGEKAFTEAQYRSMWKRLQEGEIPKRVREVTQRDLAMEKVLESLGGRDDLIAKARELAKVGDDPIAIAKWVQQQQQMTLRQGLTSFWKVNLLSGPMTQVKNVTDTALMGALRTPTNALAAIYDVPLAAIGKRQAEGTLRGSGVGLAAAFREGLPNGARSFVEVMRHGFTAEQARRMEIPLREFKLGGGKNPYNAIPRLMGASDQFFKEFTRAGERWELAYNQAAKEGLKGEALQSRMAALVEDDAILAKADEAAKYYTYTSDPGELVQGILRLKKAKFGGIIDFVLPFVSTPSNSFLRKVDYSPLGLWRLAKQLDPEVHNTPGAVSQVLAKATIGTVGWVMAAQMIRDNEITGAVPEDAGARDAFYRSGRKPYSIKAGPYWISYQSTPYVTMLATVASVKENFWTKGKRTPKKVFFQMGADFIKAFTDQSFLSGITALSDVLQNPERSAESYAGRQIGGVIPLSALLRNVANATDDTLRKPGGSENTFRNVGENIQAQLPIVNRKLPPRVDAMGQEIKRSPSGLGVMQPYVGARDSTDPVEKELARLRIFPTAPKGDVKVKNEDVKLTPDQLTGLQKAVGQAVKERAEKIINSAYYKQLTDEKKTDRLDDELRKVRLDARTRYLNSIGIQVGRRRRRRSGSSGFGF